MKKCPFCAEEIQDDAIKCRFCSEFLMPLQAEKKVPWYFRGYVILVGFLCIGPLVLPLIWFHPKYSTAAKIVFTAVIIFISVLLFKLLRVSMQGLQQYYEILPKNY